VPMWLQLVSSLVLAPAVTGVSWWLLERSLDMGNRKDKHHGKRALRVEPPRR
jgi:hypothetical protein